MVWTPSMPFIEWFTYFWILGSFKGHHPFLPLIQPLVMTQPSYHTKAVEPYTEGPPQFPDPHTDNSVQSHRFLDSPNRLSPCSSHTHKGILRKKRIMIQTGGQWSHPSSEERKFGVHWLCSNPSLMQPVHNSVVLWAFHCWDETPETINRKQVKGYFGSSFQRFHPMSLSACGSIAHHTVWYLSHGAEKQKQKTSLGSQ